MKSAGESKECGQNAFMCPCVCVQAVLCSHMDLGFICQCVCVHLYRCTAVWVCAVSVPLAYVWRRGDLEAGSRPSLGQGGRAWELGLEGPELEGTGGPRGAIPAQTALTRLPPLTSAGLIFRLWNAALGDSWTVPDHVEDMKGRVVVSGAPSWRQHLVLRRMATEEPGTGLGLDSDTRALRPHKGSSWESCSLCSVGNRSQSWVREAERYRHRDLGSWRAGCVPLGNSGSSLGLCLICKQRARPEAL